MNVIDKEILTELEEQIDVKLYEFEKHGNSSTGYLFNEYGNVTSISLSSLLLKHFPYVIFNFNFIGKIILENIIILDKNWINIDIKKCYASTSMKVIMLHNLSINEIPKFIFSFPNLKVLSLVSNKLESISEGISKLHNLEILMMEIDQKINSLSILSKLKRLEALGIYNTKHKNFNDLLNG